jgi:hypothetical protein
VNFDPGQPFGLERRLSQLATERTALFGKAATELGLSRPDQERLSAIERELDECFLTRRKQRAARDADRFSSDGYSERTSTPRRAP